MRRFLLVTLSSAFLSACSPGEVLDLGGDAGQSNEKATAPTGVGGSVFGAVPPTGASTGAAPPPDASIGPPSTGPSSEPTPFTGAPLVCASIDASEPSLDPGDGSASAYSVPLPGTGSPASASDGWILFDSDVGMPGLPQLYAIHPDGSGLVLMGGGTEPVASPDGTTLAWTGEDDIGTPQVWVTYLPGTSSRQLTSMNAGAGQAAFSPDGKSIAFHSADTIYLMNADGTDVRVIASNGGYEHPTFAPDGTLIVDQGNEIDSFDVSGPGGGSVVGNYTTTEIYPTVSRDGVTLAFIVGGCNGPVPGHIGLMAFGSYLPDPCNACLGSGYNLGQLAHPSWGPRTLLTFSHASGNGLSRIVVSDTANLSAEPVEILQDNGNQRDPSWAPSSLQL